MRRMSFALTEAQFVAGTKTVTRRLGWLNLKPGTLLLGVNKSMGLKRGEQARQLGVIRVLHVRREPLDKITDDDVVCEGFPSEGWPWFVKMFVDATKCSADTEITRIEFAHLTQAELEREGLGNLAHLGKDVRK
jgi:hypothetical protein